MVIWQIPNTNKSIKLPSGSLVYLCCGYDLKSPLQLFGEIVTQFHFVDLYRIGLQDIRQFIINGYKFESFRRRLKFQFQKIEELTKNFERRSQNAILSDKLNTFLLNLQFIEDKNQIIQNSPKMDVLVHLHSMDGVQFLLQSDPFAIFYMGSDSGGEGGSDIRFSQSPLIDLLLSKIVDGGLIIGDFWENRNYFREFESNVVTQYNGHFLRFIGHIENKPIIQVFHSPRMFRVRPFMGHNQPNEEDSMIFHWLNRENRPEIQTDSIPSNENLGVFNGTLLKSSNLEVLEIFEENYGLSFRDDRQGKRNNLTIENHQIVSLDLSNYQFTSLPPNFYQLSGLRTLNLANNEIEQLPDNFNQLSWLKELNLSNNKLYSFPFHFPFLQKLNLSKNKLKNIPESISQLVTINTSFLRELDLHGNLISDISDSINNLVGLDYLDLSNNKLEFLPNTIGKLSTLSHLNLGNNILIDLPESLANLELLTSLNLSSNLFKTVPQVVSRLKKLIKLDISNNLLSSFPKIIDLNKIKTLHLEGNPYFQLELDFIMENWLISFIREKVNGVSFSDISKQFLKRFCEIKNIKLKRWLFKRINKMIKWNKIRRDNQYQYFIMD